MTLVLQGKENSNIEILKQNIAFLQNELSSNNETSLFYTMPKSSSKSEIYSPTQCQSLHHLQPQSEERDIHPCFQQFPNQLHTQQTNETQKYDELNKNN